MIDQTSLIDTLTYSLLVIKLLIAMISFWLAIKIRRLSSYILNYLFYLAFLGWGVYISAEAILYIIAPFSAFTLAVANILLDISMIMISLIPLSFIQAAFMLKEGEEIAFHQKRKRLVAAFVVNFVIIIGVILNDSIIVTSGGKVLTGNQLPPTGKYMVSFDSRWLTSGINSTTLPGFIAFIFYLTYVVWYVAGISIMTSVARAETNGKKRMRLILIIIGILLIPAGIVYFVLKPLLLLFENLSANIVLSDDLDFIGQVMWLLSPAVVYLGLRIKVVDVPTGDF
jgi:hypothetical protein